MISSIKPLEVCAVPRERGVACPSCGEQELLIFYALDKVPVHSVLLMPTRETALGYPTGQIELALCQFCGFISNLVFDAGVMEYCQSYEETQGFSPTFNSFQRSLALRLIDRYSLRRKRVLEIGCGKGEFLALLCLLGDNRGFGFDPTYVPARVPAPASGTVEYICDFYSEKYADCDADFVCCKMTLEHIPAVAEFVSMVRRSLGNRTETIVFFQVPNVARILDNLAFWDIYYEHCSYFTLSSLAWLFRQCGFEVLDLETGFAEQYLMIGARPTGLHSGAATEHESLDYIAPAVQRFSRECTSAIAAWRNFLQELRAARQQVVLWGGGSKAVSFLTTLGIREEISYAVDINPFKHKTYLAGTGHEIVSPEFLRTYHPDVVIAMNGAYLKEIRKDLARMGLRPRLLALDAGPPAGKTGLPS